MIKMVKAAKKAELPLHSVTLTLLFVGLYFCKQNGIREINCEFLDCGIRRYNYTTIKSHLWNRNKYFLSKSPFVEYYSCKIKIQCSTLGKEVVYNFYIHVNTFIIHVVYRHNTLHGLLVAIQLLYVYIMTNVNSSSLPEYAPSFEISSHKMAPSWIKTK